MASSARKRHSTLSKASRNFACTLLQGDLFYVKASGVLMAALHRRLL
jgi:hypothetical protein